MRRFQYFLTRAVAGVVLTFVLSCVPAQADEPVPLRDWTAPLYYQPSADAEAAAAKPGVAREAAAGPRDATAPAGALVFVAMTPCRVVDTRAGSGFPFPFGATGPLAGGATPTNGQGRYP